jgi:hypothetical protein
MRPGYNVEPYYRVIILTTEQRPEKVGLPLQLRGSSVIQMGPGRLFECPWPASVGSTWEEGLIGLYEDMLQFSKPIYIYKVYCPVLSKSKKRKTREIHQHLL